MEVEGACWVRVEGACWVGTEGACWVRVEGACWVRVEGACWVEAEGACWVGAEGALWGGGCSTLQILLGWRVGGGQPTLHAVGAGWRASSAVEVDEKGRAVGFAQ